MTTCSPDEKNDIAIIGAGPAGLAAALYCARAGLKTIVYGDPYSSQLAKAGVIENYLSVKSTSGIELIESMVSHATEVGANLVDKQIKQITRDSNGIYSLFDGDGESDCAYAVILASGTKHKKLGAKGEEEFTNKGVGYCTICDGPLYKDQPIAIVGFGDEAVQAALRMTSIASKVSLISTKARLGADSSLVDELDSNPNVDLFENSKAIEIFGNDDGVTGFKFRHSGMDQEVAVNAVFIEVGVLPSSAIASGLGVELDGQFIKVDKEQSTNITGFYAAGDITGGKAKQAIVSSGDGARAAIEAIDYIKSLGVSLSKLKTTQWGGKKSSLQKPETSTDVKVVESTISELYDYVQSDSGFAAGYDRYIPRIDTLSKVKELLPNAKVTVISAKWCPDCRRNVPKMARIVEQLPWEVEIRDRDEEGIIDKFNIKKIPTFIISDSNNQEITRIIEKPKYSNLEEDLLKIAENSY
ncbi:MAG: FAD-dependent oxidoreductase [Candidatus Heimdallarchaeota archaeon]|nr:FAD-dependent oxidoreductase [Candidatus Heimdallarchaeota archaeon]